ncbi:hypothetical protein [Myxococcus sp. RHSTA-1-4]|nr:hypothetical protein [Myxococcus sp. RHSTA-1-4]
MFQSSLRAPAFRATASESFMPFPTMSGACDVCHVGRNPVDLD